MLGGDTTAFISCAQVIFLSIRSLLINECKLSSLDNPINAISMISGTTGADLGSLLHVSTVLAVGVKLFGLFPVPTLSN